MLLMIIQMTLATSFYVILTLALCHYFKDKEINNGGRVFIGVLFGLCSVLSTHFGIDYGNMILNVRDIGPLAAGLFFDPVSGVIAGLIGGIERNIAGTYFGISSYTSIACSVSTCLAGFLAMILNIHVFKGKKPAPFYAFFLGAVMEVFHMYAVFITHLDDIEMAFLVVRVCSIPMIFFTGLGLAVTSGVLAYRSGDFVSPFANVSDEKKPIAMTFQKYLFIVTFAVMSANFVFNFLLQTQSAYQRAVETLKTEAMDLMTNIVVIDGMEIEGKEDPFMIAYRQDITDIHVGRYGEFDIVDGDGEVLSGNRKGQIINEADLEAIRSEGETKGSWMVLFDSVTVCRIDKIRKDLYLLTMMPTSEVFFNRNVWAYMTGLSEILLFTVVYVIVSYLLYRIVESNMTKVNESLSRITDGDLNEVVDVRSSTEFSALSNDINQTVGTLKGYITAAEKKMEEELMFAYTIQDSALPKNFVFPGHDEFEMFALMDPAKEVGGDFYDFFFLPGNRLALVIADVSGKGIPAALFMMRSKTAIRSLAESGKGPGDICFQANNQLCDGNDAGMFVTAWIGILDLTTGLMKCANAGHEYPVIMHENGEYEYLKDKHSVALGTLEDLPTFEYELTVLPGDRIYVYTDGVPEAIDLEEEQYGADRILGVLNEHRDSSMTELLPVVREDVSDFAGGADQFDDITMLGFHFKYFYSGEETPAEA